MKYVIFSLINYLIGSVPWALVIGKVFYHTDVRQYGSGNPGATNTGRVLGRRPAFIVAFLDGLKGTLAYLLEALINPSAALFAALFTVIGHCWPLFASFKGGKGVATAFGVILGVSLSDWKMLDICFIIPVIVWFLISHFTEYVSLASLFALLVSACLSTLACDNIYVTLVFTLIFALVAFRHHENIKRLIEGNESKKNY
ncbi:MAG: glycerol-3-phosphate 1-O-acyltransferase PlsY [Erysipelotrichaceae bacterium]|nr:glycerol-3-phosphate 1-O-acyltransferase PlsY [Erysipelotrichaceae bacterium]